MKKLQTIILLGLLLFVMDGKAQLLPQFSQYMFCDYLLNPAIGGTHDYWQIRTNYRHQWAGITDAPKTYMLGTYGPHKRLPMGYGGYIFNDMLGPFSSTGVYGSYAYNIQITGDIRLSMGLFAGLVYEKVDLSVLDPEDPMYAANGEAVSKAYPDGSLGTYLYTSQYFFGISANHLFFNNTSLSDDIDEFESTEKSRIKQYFNIQGGYKYNINRNFDLVPTILIKTGINYDFMTDISVRTIYQKQVWGGASMRYNFKNPEAIMIFVGYNYNDMVNIGYSYDITLSSLNSSSNGTHEIMIGVKFKDIRRSRSKRKIR